jgi:fructose-1,6-bisphosphatase I
MARHEPAGDEVKAVVTVIAQACAQISKVVASGAISGSLGAAGVVNVQDEEQKKLDIITNDILRDALNGCPLVAGLASEELEVIETTGAVGGFLVTFDPLDGSSNIDVNVSVGTIFSILPAPAGVAPSRGRLPAARPPAGRRRLRGLRPADHAGSDPVQGRGGLHAGRRRRLAADPPDHRHPGRHRRVRDQHVQPAPLGAAGAAYIDGCLQGKSGPRGKNFNMRWVASMVADVHRILMRGGIFMYPWDAREPDKPGKLRLLYEANPMSLIVERAGGKSTDGKTPILDLQPTKLHQRVPVVLGSANEVALVAELSAG